MKKYNFKNEQIMKILVLISGHARVGKNTFANFLEEDFKKHNLTVVQDAFATGVKEGCKNDFKPLIDYLNEYTEQIKTQLGCLCSFNKNMPLDPFLNIEHMLDQLKTKEDNWYDSKTSITRLLMQIYGTNIFRLRVDSDYWSKQTKKRFYNNKSDVTLINDCRFPEEILIFNEVDQYKLITIRVERNLNTDKRIASHESETALDSWNSWSYIIDNNNSLQELKNKAILVTNDILTD
jgi:hypothetical protein